MYLLYSALLAIALFISLPYWLWQAALHGKYRAGFWQRWGRPPQRLLGSIQPVIWVHAVSVGEVLAVSGVVKELGRRFPDYRVVVSTTTDTGQKLAREKFGAYNVFYFPLDFQFAIRPYFARLAPKLTILAETEFWPNFLRLARRNGAVAVINARISDRSRGGYLRFRSLLKPVLENVNLFLAQSEEDRNRLLQIGAPADRVQVSGNLKFDIKLSETPPIVADLQAALKNVAAGPVLVCGSTVDGEETLLLDSFDRIISQHENAVMILAPRHPERFQEISDLLHARKVLSRRRSEWRGESLAGGVLLLDSIGELAALYAVADVAFVGGSLVPRGGHNIIEPARFGVAILVGPHTENFRDVIELFRSGDAVRITDASRLADDLLQLLSDDAGRAALGRRAAETLEKQTGATQRTLAELQKLLEPR